MPIQSTWCDALFVQAVAVFQNVATHIIESHENLVGETSIEPHYLAQHPSTTIYLGHLDELRYVSTAAVTCGSDVLGKSTQYIFEVNRTTCSFKQPQNSSPKRK